MAGALAAGVAGISLYFLPYSLRSVLRFGREEHGSCRTARVRLLLSLPGKEPVEGWGETPLGAAWAWPSELPLSEREAAMAELCVAIAAAWLGFDARGHALELGWLFLERELPRVLADLNAGRRSLGREELPRLAGLVCAAAFDLALHDAYGRALGLPSFATYGSAHLDRDLAWFYGEGKGSAFAGRRPSEFLSAEPAASLLAWHLVGAADRLEGESSGPDGYPASLGAWIRRDGIQAVKVKLCGSETDGGYSRFCAAADAASTAGVGRLGLDWNGSLPDVESARAFFGRLSRERPELLARLEYAEQPVAPSSTASLGGILPSGAPTCLVLDEGGLDWRSVDEGARRAWTGMALKTCKTLTGSLLALCRARAASMKILVQDLTNPMLALVPHALLAAHAGEIQAFEANAAQFCPEASKPEATKLGALYERRGGRVRLEGLEGAGFGYAGAERVRSLPAAAFAGGAA